MLGKGQCTIKECRGTGEDDKMSIMQIHTYMYRLSGPFKNFQVFWFPALYFYDFLEHMSVYVSVSICVPCTFALALFFYLFVVL